MQALNSHEHAPKHIRTHKNIYIFSITFISANFLFIVFVFRSHFRACVFAHVPDVHHTTSAAAKAAAAL